MTKNFKWIGFTKIDIQQLQKELGIGNTARKKLFCMQ